MKLRITHLVMLLFVSALMFGQMTTAWTTTQPNRQIPTSGFTVPTVSSLTSPQSVTFIISLPDSLDAATAAGGLTAIGAAVKMEIDTNWLVPIWGIDTSIAATGVITLTDVRRRWTEFEIDDLKNQYLTATPIFRIRGRFQWELD